MRAARIHDFGGPDQLRIEEIDRPDPAPGEALVRIRAAAVNPVDWMIREHRYNPEGADRLPLTLGQDFAGTVERLGADGDGSLRPGDAVFGETWGSFADYAAVPVEALVRKPDSLDFAVAASIPMPALTAWQMVVDTADAGPDMRFLIHGASGGVGAMAAQLALWRGARVIATASRPSFDFLESIGVEQIIDYEHQRFEDEVQGTVDVVIDPLGGETQARSWGLLASGGLLINLIGDVDREAARAVKARAVAFGMEYATGDLERVAELMGEGTLRPHVARVLPFAEVRQALDLNQQGRSHGKVVLELA